MAKHALTDAGIWFGGFDFSGDMNACELQLGADGVEVTCFGAAARNYLPGLKRSVFSAQGYFGAANPDAALEANLGVGSDDLLVAPETSVGAVAYMLASLLAEYQWGGALGEANRFSIAVAAEDLAIRGQVEALETVAASGASDGVQLGALSSSQRIWAMAMTTGALGGTSPTLDLKLQSDDNGDFSSATDRITFGQWTTRAQDFQSLDGAVTDDYWRFSWTLGGSDTPTVPLVAAFGIVSI